MTGMTGTPLPNESELIDCQFTKEEFATIMVSLQVRGNFLDSFLGDKESLVYQPPEVIQNAKDNLKDIKQVWHKMEAIQKKVDGGNG